MVKESHIPEEIKILHADLFTLVNDTIAGYPGVDMEGLAKSLKLEQFSQISDLDYKSKKQLYLYTCEYSESKHKFIFMTLVLSKIYESRYHTSLLQILKELHTWYDNYRGRFKAILILNILFDELDIDVHIQLLKAVKSNIKQFIFEKLTRVELTDIQMLKLKKLLFNKHTSKQTAVKIIQLTDGDYGLCIDYIDDCLHDGFALKLINRLIGVFGSEQHELVKQLFFRGVNIIYSVLEMYTLLSTLISYYYTSEATRTLNVDYLVDLYPYFEKLSANLLTKFYKLHSFDNLRRLLLRTTNATNHRELLALIENLRPL